MKKFASILILAISSVSLLAQTSGTVGYSKTTRKVAPTNLVYTAESVVAETIESTEGATFAGVNTQNGQTDHKFVNLTSGTSVTYNWANANEYLYLEHNAVLTPSNVPNSTTHGREYRLVTDNAGAYSLTFGAIGGQHIYWTPDRSTNQPALPPGARTHFLIIRDRTNYWGFMDTGPIDGTLLAPGTVTAAYLEGVGNGNIVMTDPVTGETKNAVEGQDYLGPNRISSNPVDSDWNGVSDEAPSLDAIWDLYAEIINSLGQVQSGAFATGTTSDTTATPIYTNALPDNSTITLRAGVVAGGPTNSYAADVLATFRTSGGVATIIGTNQTNVEQTSTNLIFYWEPSGLNALGIAKSYIDENQAWLATNIFVRAVTNGSAAPPSGFTANGAVFDGTDYATRSHSVAINGWTDSSKLTISAWIRFDGGDGVLQYIVYNNTSGKLTLTKNSSNQIVLTGKNTGGNTTVSITSSVTKTASSGWFHLLVGFDSASANNGTIWFDGVQDTSATVTVTSPTTIDLLGSSSDVFRVAGGASGVNKMTGAIAELWITRDTYITDTTKFLNSGLPISLGADGSTPTGTAPQFYFSLNGQGNSWLIDSSGRGNDLTLSTAGPLGSVTLP